MKKIFIVFLALIAVFSCTAFAAVPDPTVYAKVTPEDPTVQTADVYQLPGEYRTVIATIKKDTSVHIIFEGSTWHQIKTITGNTTGWMRAADLRITTRGYSAANFGCTLKTAAYVNSSDGFAALRWGPATYYDIIDNIPNGRYVWKYETVGSWTRVLLEDGRSGYIYSNLLKNTAKIEAWPGGLFAYVQVSGNTANVRSGASFSSGISGNLRSGTIIEIISEKNNFYNFYDPATGKTGYISYDIASPESLNKTATSALLYYDNPTAYVTDAIWSIAPNTVIKVLASDGYVSRIQYAKGEGYVFDNTLAY